MLQENSQFTGRQVELAELKPFLGKKTSIQKRRVTSTHLPALPGWETIMGLQFENLVVNNRHELYRVLNIKPEDVVYDNPYFQMKTKRQQGCQIDFLIQTRINTLYIIEIKFSKNAIGRGVIDEVQEKIKRIGLPKNMVCLPILVHVNGVSEQVISENYFNSIISFGQFLHN